MSRRRHFQEDLDQGWIGIGLDGSKTDLQSLLETAWRLEQHIDRIQWHLTIDRQARTITTEFTILVTFWWPNSKVALSYTGRVKKK